MLVFDSCCSGSSSPFSSSFDFALPLDFHGRVRVVRSMYLSAALHGIEAPLLASDSLRKLRSSICSVVWSRRQPMANVGAVLSLLDGPTGCDFAFCVVWFRFRFFRRCLALWPAEVGRVYRLLEMVGEGCPGRGPVHLLSASAAEIGFRWDPPALAWSRPGLPLLSNLAGPVQHFKAAILDAWRNKVSVDLCGRKGFRGGPLLDVHGSLQLLNSSRSQHHGWGVSGMVLFFVKFVVRMSRVSLVVRLMGMVICSGNVPFLLLLRFVKILSFMISWEWIRDIGHGVCFGKVGFLSCLVLMVPLLGLLEPGFLLISLLPVGIIGVGAMLIKFARLVNFRLVMFFALLQDLSSLFRELRCGVSFLLCSPLVLFILVLTIWVSFVMCWSVD